MEIEKLILVNYTRFPLTQPKKVIYTPSHKIQVILGSNGSGKSSLLKELSPFSVSKKDINNGYKNITISHNGNLYTLKSGYYDKSSRKFKHSFVVDGVEYNKSHNLPVQKQLIEEHFNYTEKEHDLFTGHMKFSQMSVSQRRDIFTQLAGSNYKFGIQAHAYLSERYRDVKGTIKILNSQLEKEVKESITEHEYKILEKSIIDLKKSINEIYKHKIPVEKSNSVIEDLRESYIKYRTLMDSIPELDYDKVSNKLSLLEKKKYAIEERLKDINKKLYELEKQYKLAKNNELIPSLKKEYEKYDNLYKEKMLSYEKQHLEDKLSKEYLEGFKSIKEKMVYYIQSIDSSIDHTTPDALSKLSKYESLKKEYMEKQSKIKNKIESITSLIETNKIQQKQQKEVCCPHCNHSFIPDTYNKEIEALERDLKMYINALSEIEPKLNEILDYINKVKKNENTISNIRQLVKLSMDYANIWKRVFKEGKESFLYPSNLINRLSIEEEQIELGISIKEIRNKLNALYKEIESKTYKGDNTLSSILKQKDKYITQINLYQDKLNLINKNIETTTSILRKINKIKSIQQHISMLHMQQYNHVKNELNIIYNQTLDEVISIYNNQLEEKEYQYNLYKSKQDRIQHIKSQLEETVKIERILSKMVNSLSPKDGLLAKGLIGYINGFIEDMNAVIELMWSYPLKIIPCELEQNDLTYRFPIKVNQNKEIPDIHQGSLSMKEIVDLAFKLTYMRYSGRTQYPLYLDEYGSSFDSVHRIESYRLIQSYIQQQPFSQVFLVTHYKEIYDQFSLADRVVLHDENIDKIKPSKGIFEVIC